MDKSSKRVMAHLALLLVAIIYGVNYIVARGVMVDDFLTPNVFILLRVVGALVLFFLFHRTKEEFTKKEHTTLFLCGLTGVAINQLLFFNGLKLTGPIQASLIMTTTPMLVYFLSLIFFNRTFHWLKGLGVVCGILGAALIVYNKNNIQYFEHAFQGNLMIFINAFSYALYLVLVKPLMTKHPPVQVLKWVFLYGLIFVLPLSVKPIMEMILQPFDRATILAILYVVFATTYITYRLNGFALSRVNPTLVSIYMYVQPMVAAIASICLGIETLTWKKGLAAALIFASILFVSWQKGGEMR